MTETTRPDPATEGLYFAAVYDGAQAERARIVVWLRDEAKRRRGDGQSDSWNALTWAASKIEQQCIITDAVRNSTLAVRRYADTIEVRRARRSRLLVSGTDDDGDMWFTIESGEDEVECVVTGDEARQVVEHILDRLGRKPGEYP